MESGNGSDGRDAERSAWAWAYSTSAECAPVKEEPEWGACGVSEAAARAGLYAGHEVKDELLVGPELLQPQDIALPLINVLSRAEEEPRELKPLAAAGAAPEGTHTRPGEGPRCSKTLEQQFQLKSCFVRLERVSVDTLKASFSTHVLGHTDALSRAEEEPRGLQPERSAWAWAYSTSAECAPVKEEPEWGACGVSEAAARAGLYAGHEVKDELLVGPEVLQPQDIALPLINVLSRAEEEPRELKPLAAAGAAPEGTHTRPGEGPRCSKTLEQQFQLKSCFVRLERVSVDTLKASFSTHVLGHTDALSRAEEEPRGLQPAAGAGAAPASDGCDGQFTHPWKSTKHAHIHASRKLFSRDVCPKQLHLVRHRRIQTQEKPYKCDVCDKQFWKNSTLIRHRRIHTKEKPFECEVCDKQFAVKYNLIVHSRIHTREKPFRCDVCGKQCTQKSNLIIHSRIHTQEKPQRCGVCGKRFRQISNLVCHRQIHTQDKPYTCDVCNIQVSRKRTLISHIRTHTKEKPYRCNVCNKQFSRNSNCIRHSRTHIQEKPYKCDVCGKQFTQKSTLIYHIRIHTKEKPYKCDVCGKQFTEKSTLIYHIRTHTKEKPYRCNVCNKQFSRNSNCIRHSRIHTKEKPYRCDVCGKQFTQKSYLIVHSRIHTKEKPYKCDVCGKQFSLNSTLVRHTRIHIREKS